MDPTKIAAWAGFFNPHFFYCIPALLGLKLWWKGNNNNRNFWTPVALADLAGSISGFPNISKKEANFNLWGYREVEGFWSNLWSPQRRLRRSEVGLERKRKKKLLKSTKKIGGFTNTAFFLWYKIVKETIYLVI